MFSLAHEPRSGITDKIRRAAAETQAVPRGTMARESVSTPRTAPLEGLRLLRRKVSARRGSVPSEASGLPGKGFIAAFTTLTLALAGLVGFYRPPVALPPGTHADLLVVHKSARRMVLYSHGAVVRSYAISLGHDPVGPKQRQGDHRTPEGWYVIDEHNPNSAFHRSLHLSYPSAQDAASAHAAGHSPGGDVMIHGTRNGLGWLGRLHLASDWTDGCIAVTDSEMDELYALVPDGTPIDIKP